VNELGFDVGGEQMALLYFLELALCYISSLVVYNIFADLFFFFFFFMQKAGYCDFFEWADKEMSAYGKRIARHLKEMERRHADNDRVDELIEKMYMFCISCN
jgi:hypothetical protein